VVLIYVFCFFFFQAEDGIRDGHGLEFRRVLFRSLVECFATSQLEAEQLGEHVHAQWLASRGGAIHWIDSDYNLAPYDPPSTGSAGATGDSGYRRYQFTGSVQFLDRAFNVS